MVSDSSKESIDNSMVVLDICAKLENLDTNEQKSHEVCISRVPKSLSSTNSQSFTPQFVGLGPYHHFRDDLIMNNEMKLRVANRVPKIKDLILHNRDTIFHKCLQNNFSEIEALYHEDVTSTRDSQTLLYSLTIDGLFLLGLLHSGPNLEEDEQSSHCYYYILTGRKQGMPLVNSSGVELTTDDVISEIFMVENQIPTHVLKHLNRVGINTNDELIEIQAPDKHLGLAMLNFCEPLCPLVHSEKQNLSKNHEGCDHLLDLMYHLVAPESELESESETESESKSDPINLGTWIIVYGLIIFIWSLAYSLKLIKNLIILVLSSLFQIVQKVITFSSGKLLNMPSFRDDLSQVIDALKRGLSKSEAECVDFKHYTEILAQIQEKRQFRRVLHQRKSKDSSEEESVIPSAIELQSLGLRFEPAEGGISSLKYDEGKRVFHFPCVRFDANSEVILRNLLAYESLKKSKGLIFARYIELLSALVLSAEDVKLLVDNKIIQNHSLSDEAVAELLKGMMMKSVGPTKIKKFEEEIKKVKEFYNQSQKSKMIWTKDLPEFLIVSAILVTLPFAILSLVQKYWPENQTSNLYNPSLVQDL